MEASRADGLLLQDCAYPAQGDASVFGHHGRVSAGRKDWIDT